jgi:hypothetical protein
MTATDETPSEFDTLIEQLESAHASLDDTLGNLEDALVSLEDAVVTNQRETEHSDTSLTITDGEQDRPEECWITSDTTVAFTDWR